MATLGDKAVGDIVRIKENGTYVNYIIIHKGLPSDMYDSSCNGVWLLREQAHSAVAWEADNTNDYENSDMKTWLNGTFLNTIDSKPRAAIKTVKIPYKKGLGNASTPVQSGPSGLSCKVFLLSGYEVGFTQTDSQYLPIDGAKLSYFSDNNSRICKGGKYNNAVYWWLRSPRTGIDSYAFIADNGGWNYNSYVRNTYEARPAFILPYDVRVDSGGNIVFNTAPTISGNKTSGSNMGTISAPFNFTYTVRDADYDTVTVYEYLDNVLQRSYTASLGATNTFQATSIAGLFQKILNGSHTIKVIATDSEGASSADYVVSFTKVNSLPTITSDKTGDLGTLADGFICQYSVNDANSGDNVAVTLSIDTTTIQTFTAVKGQQYTYILEGADWLKITNGSHTFKITATDGKDTATSTATFTRNCTALSTTLSAPKTAEGKIIACTLKVEGSIPEDAVCKYEVTNNANDSSPVWEDCTAKTKAGLSHIFANKTAENGFAFNYRIAIERGASGTGGYITKVSGGFE